MIHKYNQNDFKYELPLSMIIQERIKALREAKRLSQYELADMLNVSQSTYLQIEKGKTELTISRLHQISEALGTSVADLLGIPAQGTVDVDLSEKKVQELEASLASATERVENLTKANSQLAELLKNSHNKLSQAESQLQDLQELQHTIPILCQALFQQIEKKYNVDLWSYQVKDADAVKQEVWFDDLVKNHRLLMILLIGTNLLGMIDEILISSLYGALRPYNGLERILLKRYETMKDFNEAFISLRSEIKPDSTDYFNLE